MKRVVLAMSGGVDSSVAARLLKQEGHDLLGVTFDFQLDGPPYHGIQDAVEVCRTLDIPHRTINRREKFRQDIVRELPRPFFTSGV